jgi:uncharacterized protein (DUF58 family)
MLGSAYVDLAAAALAGTVLADAALTPLTTKLTVRRVAPARMTYGRQSKTDLYVYLDRARRRAAGTIALTDFHPALGSARVAIPDFTDKAFHAVLRRTPERSGYWPSQGTLTIRTFSPLGGFTRSRLADDIQMPCWVHPPIGLEMSLETSTVRSQEGASAHSMSEDFHSLRPMRPGDPKSAIHWRTSARRDEPTVIDRRSAAGCLVVTANDLGSGEVWEQLLSDVAATLISYMLRDSEVLLMSAGIVRPARQPREVLDWLAELEIGLSGCNGPIRFTRPDLAVLCISASGVLHQDAHRSRAVAPHPSRRVA